MTRSATNPKVDFFFEKDSAWQAEYKKLRDILLECPLTEDLKWGQPCYTLGTQNIVLIHGFKEYCALLFFKGALLKDPPGMLIQQTQNVQAARQLRFTSLEEITEKATLITAYVHEAIEVEKSGQKVAFKKTADFAVPEEFQIKLDEMPELKTAFEALTPGRQKAYLLHFGSAKQVKTREARIEKAMPDIFNGKGLDD
jgi:uncharacterized protein YdeI (YjbR/CyaY-like superfamily)